MNPRARITMTEDEVAAFIAGARKLQLGTINPDGTPHLVTMFYGLTEDRISFWTYGRAQKTRNIERDARVSCLIETGEDYGELRGVLVYGTARRIDIPDEVFGVGMTVARRIVGLPGDDESMDDTLRDHVAETGRKRVAFTVEPTRVVSWDHRKLAPPA